MPRQLQVSTGSNNLTGDNNLNEGKRVVVGGWGMREADSREGFFCLFFQFYPALLEAGYFSSLTWRIPI